MTNELFVTDQLGEASQLVSVANRLTETERSSTTSEVMTPNQGRDYMNNVSDVAQAIERLVAGLKEDGDEYRMFALLGTVLRARPDIVMPIVRDSIVLAQERLGQNRASGSSATLLYPIDAAVRTLARRTQFMLTDSLSANNWDETKLIEMMWRFPTEIAELAGSNTTSKNLPQRAAHLLWMLDQCPLVRPNQQFSFLEIGASGGLILDALQQPLKFRNWMNGQGYRSDFTDCCDKNRINQTLGIDLVKPELDWLQAVILEDGLRSETTKFIGEFARSEVITADATALNQNERVQQFFARRGNNLPVIFSCFVFYQLDESTRTAVSQQARELLQSMGGGLFIVSDIAKYRGYPDKAGGCVSWIEDQDGNQVSPAIMATKSTLTEWEVL